MSGVADHHANSILVARDPVPPGGAVGMSYGNFCVTGKLKWL